MKRKVIFVWLVSLALTNLVFAGTTFDPAKGSNLMQILEGINPCGHSPTMEKDLYSNMSPIGLWVSADITERLEVSGNLALICAESNGFVVVNADDPYNPYESGRLGNINAIGVAAQAQYAYVADSLDGLHVIDISNPNIPLEVGNLAYSSFPIDVAATGNYVVLIEFGGDLHVIDITNPLVPVEVGTLDWNKPSLSIEIHGSYAYVLNYDFLDIVDLGNPTNPTVINSYPIADGGISVALRDRFAYIGGYLDFRILDISDPLAIQEVGILNMGDWVNDVWLRDDFAYISTNTGVSMIDISDNSHPVETGYHQTGVSSWGVREVGNFVAFTGYSLGLQIDQNDLLPTISPDLDVSLVGPVNLQIPMEGGSFTYDVSIENTTTSDITADVGIQAVLPDGSLYNVLYKPNVNFPASDTIVRNGLAQAIPANAPAGIYTYRISVGPLGGSIIDSDEFTFEKLGVAFGAHDPADWNLKGWDEETQNNTLPAQSILASAFPNPFNPITKLNFALTQPAMVELRIYDLRGQLVRTLVAGRNMPAGSYTETWQGDDDLGQAVGAGVYLVQLKAGNFSATQRVTMIK